MFAYRVFDATHFDFCKEKRQNNIFRVLGVEAVILVPSLQPVSAVCALLIKYNDVEIRFVLMVLQREFTNADFDFGKDELPE